jgi:NAD dependent epimerase/dehydratase family enzyme
MLDRKTAIYKWGSEGRKFKSCRPDYLLRKGLSLGTAVGFFREIKPFAEVCCGSNAGNLGRGFFFAIAVAIFARWS